MFGNLSRMGMGSISSSSFNSTKYPGICKPSTTATLAVFKSMQQQLNRVASIKGLPKVAVDGDVGPGTVQLAGYVKAVAAADATGADTTGDNVVADNAATLVDVIDASSCVAIASRADDIAANAQMYATALGAPAAVPAPVNTSPTVLVSSTGAETQISGSVQNAAASLSDSFGALGTVEKVVVVGALGIAGYIVLGIVDKPKKRKRRY